MMPDTTQPVYVAPRANQTAGTAIRIKLSDGSSWPRPYTADMDRSPSWAARYDHDGISRSELLQLAAMADAYGYLICETTRARRGYGCA
jgi:hypothetical protein